ncbi:hypothetical protein [Janthinobacterium aquaticum]|uniref:hypothetical protein n=1 Tax=Janthinobacterium sp. FT58W TaxID=2654254 RepID=UPI0012659EFA|nr:hypothetical protein [Janthinobacterium sp. FT58W]KAB8042449.1 hypothetical protein GCM43_12995 [Janthinobacterium sp. FT58W]
MARHISNHTPGRPDLLASHGAPASGPSILAQLEQGQGRTMPTAPMRAHLRLRKLPVALLAAIAVLVSAAVAWQHWRSSETGMAAVNAPPAIARAPATSAPPASPTPAPPAQPVQMPATIISVPAAPLAAMPATARQPSAHKPARRSPPRKTPAPTDPDVILLRAMVAHGHAINPAARDQPRP